MEGLTERWITPIIRRQVRKPDDPANDALRQLILDNERKERQVPNSPQPLHSQVFESTFDFLDWPDPPALALKQLIHRGLAEAIINLSNVDQQQLMRFRIVCESWFHVTRTGGYVRSHNHPQHSWSAIYCVDPGDEQPANDHDAGYIQFFDPRVNADMFLDMANSDLKSRYNGHSMRFRPRTGDMILFPSFVWHAVEPYHGERPRITVAANFRFNAGS